MILTMFFWLNRAPDLSFSLGALWPLTENFRGTTRNFRGTFNQHANIITFLLIFTITNNYFDNRCRNYNVPFQIQCDILLWFSSIPTVSMFAHTCVRQVRKRQFHGSAPTCCAAWQDAEPPLCLLASPLRMHYQALQMPPVWKALCKRDFTGFG